MELIKPYGKFGLLVTLPMLFLCILHSQASAADILQKKIGNSKDGPVVIRSKSLEIDNKKRVVSFTGPVEARKEDMLIRCRQMFVYYEEKSQSDAAEKKDLKIDRIVAKGEVRIDRDGGVSATAEEAIYYESEEKIVLRGKPVVKQDDDSVEGSVITLFLREDRSVVEGAGEERVRAVLSPRNRKR